MKFIVRELSRQDLEPIYKIYSNQEIALLTNNKYHSFTDFCSQYELYLTGKAVEIKIFSILLDDQVIGIMELGYDLVERTGVFAIAIDQTFWGKGLAQKALKVLFNYGFNNLHLNKISCEVFSFNKRSLRFMQKNGLHLDGILREDRFINNQFTDVYIFSILKKEFIPR